MEVAANPQAELPVALLQSISNAVNTYAAQGFCALERLALQALPLTSEQQLLVLRGTAELYGQGQSFIAAGLQRYSQQLQQIFEPKEAERPLHSPKADQLQDSLPELKSQHGELDAELAALRAQIAEGHATKFRMQSELRTLEADAIAEGDVQQLSEVAALGASKENVSDNAEVLSSLSQQLKQLITRADRLQQQHEAMLSATNTGEDSKLTKLLARQADGKDCLMGQDVQNIVRQLQLSD